TPCTAARRSTTDQPLLRRRIRLVGDGRCGPRRTRVTSARRALRRCCNGCYSRRSRGGRRDGTSGFGWGTSGTRFVASGHSVACASGAGLLTYDRPGSRGAALRSRSPKRNRHRMFGLLSLGFTLSLDNFRSSLVLGGLKPTFAQSVKTSAIFGLWDGVAPLVGIIVGSLISEKVSGTADTVAIIGLGTYGLFLIGRAVTSPERPD